MTKFDDRNPYLLVDYECLIQNGAITGAATVVVESLFGGFGFASRRDRMANSIGPGGVIFLFGESWRGKEAKASVELVKAFGTWVDDAQIWVSGDHQVLVYRKYQLEKRSRPPVFAMVKTGRGQHWAPYSNVIQYGNKTRG